jgi:hypothetical protein
MVRHRIELGPHVCDVAGVQSLIERASAACSSEFYETADYEDEVIDVRVVRERGGVVVTMVTRLGQEYSARASHN